MKVPLLPTLVVAAAITVMIRLGFWQLERAAWKDSLLATYAAASHQPAVAWPRHKSGPLPLFRSAYGDCTRVSGWDARAGHNRAEESGYSYFAACPDMTVEAGWARRPDLHPSWTGGAVRGTIAPDSRDGMRLVSADGLGGLEAAAPPRIDSIPNNHRSYAFQWFAFAATALIIYLLALRRRRMTA